MTTVDGRRRNLLIAGASGLAILLAGCVGSDDDIDPDAPPEEQIDTHLSDANSYDGEIVDLTGESSVTVENGAEGTDYRFAPAAIRIDQGTTVIWEWVGSVAHTVTHRPIADEEEAFDSGQISGDGETWEYTFTDPGVYLYVCTPHKGYQRGAVLVE